MTAGTETVNWQVLKKEDEEEGKQKYEGKEELLPRKDDKQCFKQNPNISSLFASSSYVNSPL